MARQIHLEPQKANGTPKDWKNGSVISPKQIAQMLMDRDPKTRRSGVMKLAGNEAALAYVAMNSKYKDTKRNAINELAERVNELKSTEALKIVAVHAHEEEQSLSAIAKLAKNVDALMYVIGNIPKNYVSDFAVGKLAEMVDELTDVDALKIVATRADIRRNNWRVAIEKLSGNVDALKDVALNPTWEEMGRVAVEKIDDMVALRDIAESSRFTIARSDAIFKLVGMMNGLTDPDALRIIAVNCSKREGRLAALEKLDDPDALRIVATKSKYEDTRLAAAAKHDQPTKFQNGLLEILMTTQTE